jgi:predicted amidohydrolase YtcJ
MVGRRARIIGCFAILLFSATALHAGGTLILTHGAVYTEDPRQPWARSIVIRGGKIVYVGDESGTLPFRDKNARIVDLAGRMVLPGFHDGHAHPMSGALRLLRCSLAGTKSLKDLSARVQVCASQRPSGPWLIGYGWPDALAASLWRLRLDTLVSDRAAYLTNPDGYKAWVNAKALAAAGIDPNGSGPAIAGVERDPKTRRPTGILEGDAINLVRRHVPPPTEAEYRAALARATQMANRYGITSMFDAAATPAMLDAYRAADRANALTVRMVAAQVVDPDRDASQIDEMAARRDRVQGRRFRADAAKFFLDEEIPFHTAAMLAPYADKPDARGRLFIAPARLNALVAALDARGFLIHMHAMGDGAVRAGLDAIEGAIRTNGPRDRRHQIAHVGVVSPDDIPRFGKLAVVANFQPLWFPADDPDAAPTEAALGPVRSRWIMPIASIAKAGGAIVGGSDWPSTAMNPVEGIEAAVTRQPMNGSLAPRQPQERVSLAAAIAAYTRNAAWAVREDSLDGTIATGKAADLVVLDSNLFRIGVTNVHRARVLLTLLDGKPVYRDPDFALPWTEPKRE